MARKLDPNDGAAELHAAAGASCPGRVPSAHRLRRPKAMIWSAYMLADSTAIYTLGHLSVTSRSADHELMALWAPFLLLHLGGQDNITAYAIEDNRLWLRHLQALIVQVAAAAYVLYESTVVGTQAPLRNASILMFVLGVIKYGERVWALKCADTGASGNKYQHFEGTICPSINPSMDWHGDTEGLLQIAYLLLDVPKNLFQGPLPKVVVHMNPTNEDVPVDKLYKVVEMQLSLMHDVMYSKAKVIYTWYGLFIRVISPAFIAIAFVLFHRSGLSVGDHQYSKADVVITYVLLGGAVTLEIVSMLRAMLSRWPSVILASLAYDEKGQRRYVWSLLAGAIASIRRFVLPKRDESKWWWSNSMGQQNLFDLYNKLSRASQVSRIMSWMGVEFWWNTMLCSSSIPVSRTIKEQLLDQMHMCCQSASILGKYQYKLDDKQLDPIVNTWGQATLKKWNIYTEPGSDLYSYLDMELDENILIWHIATNIYLHWYKRQEPATVDVEATEAISNYMLFLLAARPYMLPGSVSRTKYVGMCYCLMGLKYNTAQYLARVLGSKDKIKYAKRGDMPKIAELIKDRKRENMPKIKGEQKVPTREDHIHDNDTLSKSRYLANRLIHAGCRPDDVLGVWTEMLLCGA
ncbi:hypothetical protein VPH35_033343 [Triticum aestivum]